MVRQWYRWSSKRDGSPVSSAASAASKRGGGAGAAKGAAVAMSPVVGRGRHLAATSYGKTRRSPPAGAEV